MTKKKPVVIPNYCGFTEDEMNGLYRFESSPFFWRQKAEELKYAADLLWPIALQRLDKISASVKKKKGIDFSKLPPEIFTTAKGLLGFSLECLFKACIIRDNPEFVKSGKQNDQMKTHNLLKLAQIGKIVLSHEEGHTCKTLTDAMYVDFRYPVDRHITMKSSITSVGRSIIDVGNDLFEKLHETVNQIHIPKGGVIKFSMRTSRYTPSKKVRKVIVKKVVKSKRKK